MCRTLFNVLLVAIGIAVALASANAEEPSTESGRRRAVGSKAWERIARQFGDIEKAVRSLHRQVNQLTQDPTFPVESVFDIRSLRTDRVGFRPVYCMNRNGSDVKLLFAVPRMLVTAAPELSISRNIQALSAPYAAASSRRAACSVASSAG